jgi:peptidoglycan-associated lipoprotein
MKMQQVLSYAVMGLVLFMAGCAGTTSVAKDETTGASAMAAKTGADKTAPEAKQQEQSRVSSTVETSAQAPSTQPSSSFEAIYFGFDSSSLSEDARRTLDKTAKQIAFSKSKLGFKIEGHCDERGSAEYNMALGEKRAQAAKNYLMTLGVPAERLSVISFGKEKPAVAGHDEQSWAKNRRDEFIGN